MNKGLIVNGILAVAVGVLYVLHFSCKSSCSIPNEETQLSGGTKVVDSESPLESTILQSKGAVSYNIGYVNADSLAAKFILSVEMTKRLADKEVEAQNRLKKKQDAALKYQKGVQEKMPSMSEDAYKRAMSDLQILQEDYFKLEQTERESLAKYSADQMKIYTAKSVGYMEKIGTELGMDYIIQYVFGGNFIYANRKLDITNQVVDKLNQMYSEEGEE